MKVTQLRVENYRAFASPQVLELRPLTLLYGYNHAGKSALLRALPLIADSSTGLYPAPLNLDSRAARKAAFDDIRCRANPDEPVVLGLDAQDEDGVPSSWQIQIDELRRPWARQLVQSWDFRRGSGPDAHELSAVWDPEGPPARERGGSYLLSGDGRKPLSARLRYEGLVPYLERGPASVEADLERVRSLLRGLRTQLQWLEAVRACPLRREPITGAPPVQLSPDGGGAAQMLAADAQEKGGLIESVRAFFRGDGGEEGRYDFRVAVEADVVRLFLAPTTAPAMAADLVDAGEGMAQVLPVLVALARAARGRADDARLVVLEQPELHLHPKLELRLGRYLCELASQPGPPTMLVETHSEALLLSIQLALLEERLNPDHVAIYWVRQIPEGESVAERVAVDSRGRLDAQWPHGSFQEVVGLARAVVQARLRRESR